MGIFMIQKANNLIEGQLCLLQQSNSDNEWPTGETNNLTNGRTVVGKNLKFGKISRLSLTQRRDIGESLFDKATPSV